MGFREELQRIVGFVHERERVLQERCAEHAFRSIRDGSPITGAPGQPWDTGELYHSYKKRKAGRRGWVIESKAPHADIIEENRRGATLRSSVGGFHSVKLTRLGWNRIVRYEEARLGNVGLGGRPTLAPNPQPRDRKGRFSWTKKARVRVRAG